MRKYTCIIIAVFTPVPMYTYRSRVVWGENNKILAPLPVTKMYQKKKSSSVSFFAFDKENGLQKTESFNVTLWFGKKSDNRTNRLKSAGIFLQKFPKNDNGVTIDLSR